MKKVLFLTTPLYLLGYSIFANAHHGFTAHYDPDQVIRIEGTIKEFQFKNPHSLLYINALDDQGEEVTYLCDLQAKNQMLRHGVDESRFAAGDKIVVEGFPARRDPLQCEYGVGYFADGTSFTLRELESGQSQFFDNPEPVAEVKTIFGNWLRAGMYANDENSGRGPSTGLDSLTEAGIAAQNRFDPVADNPMTHCKGGSPVRNWGAPGLATSITQQDGNVHIYHESMDITRVVYMNGEVPPEGFEPNDMGYSVGRFEGDKLIIETNRFIDGVITTGVVEKPSVNSDQLAIQETLEVLDNGRLKISWVVDEPLYYSELITGSQVLQPTSKEILPYDCTQEAHY